MPVGAEVVRPLGQPGEQRPSVERQRLRRLAEIAARRHLDAPRAAAEIDRVEIELEDLGLLSVRSMREATIISRGSCARR